ncbi:cupin domain-containing protein [Amycolatopsis albispora]|uniref:Cupin n=1 Tax=Amycolatopsis albispora TaxID=1804986 RepID=A0A344L9W2_9PSEU|nr:cupin domain-containing protein [Amycolatopsis albispora]AXB44836.1 cupin [Amycolatopsis albispora]
MTVATLAGAPSFERGGVRFRPLAVPSRGSAELAVWALEVAPGEAGEAHRVSREEVFVLHQGQVTATLDGQPYHLAPGDAFILPPDREFSLSNPGGEPAHLTVCTSKGLEGVLANGERIAPPWAQ